MKRYLLAAVLMLSALPVAAQQPPVAADTAFMQKAIGALQAQRNEALDRLTGAEARLAIVADDLAKANAEVARLKSKYEQPPAEPKKE